MSTELIAIATRTDPAHEGPSVEMFSIAPTRAQSEEILDLIETRVPGSLHPDTGAGHLPAAQAHDLFAAWKTDLAQGVFPIAGATSLSQVIDTLIAHAETGHTFWFHLDA